MNKQSGIYHIQVGPWYYYGQSVDLVKRKYNHLYRLKQGIHKNRILQNAFNKYQDFKFDIIGELPVDELNGAEQFFIDCFYGEDHCANIAMIAENSPMLGRKHSVESRAKMGRTGRPNANSKPVEVNGIQYRSQSEAARQLGVTATTIRNRINKITDDE